jgi:hypothetical protein
MGPHIERLGQDVELSDGGGELEITVGDGSPGVVGGDQFCGDGCGPCLSPEEGLEVALRRGHEVNAAEALFGSITSSLGGRDSVGDQFIDECGTRPHILHQPMEVLKEGMCV